MFNPLSPKTNQARDTQEQTLSKSLAILVTSLLLYCGIMPWKLPLLANTPAGTEIRNQGVGTFEDVENLGTVVETTSNEVVLIVAEVAGITVGATGVEEAPGTVTGAGPNQNDGSINPEDIIYYTFTLTNVGNDSTQFFIPDAPSSITGGTLAGDIQLMSYDPDGTGSSTEDLTANNITVPSGGATTGTLLNGIAAAYDGAVLRNGSIAIRVPIKIDANLNDQDLVEDYQLTIIAPSGPPTGTVCYTVSDGSSPDRLIQVDINTGVASDIGSLGSGITRVEAIAYWPITGTLYGANADRLGTINTTTGTFTPVGTTFGSGSGSAGNKDFDDVDGLTFDPNSGELYGSVRDGDGRAPEDLLIKIDPATGSHIPDAFGPGVDYLVIRTASATGYNDIDDITIDPDDGQLYGIANQGSDSTDRFVRIDRTDGTVTQVGSFGLSDAEGMNSFNDGSIYLSTGNSSGNNQDNRFYQVNKISGSVTEIGDLNSLGYDYEGIACLTGAPNSISGTVFFDDGGTTGTANDGILNGDEAGNDGVTVRLFRDSDASGTVTAGDIPLATQVTSGGGNYSFVVASTGDFVLEIEQNTLPAGQALTTDNLEVANFGVSLGASDTGNNFGHSIPPSLDYGDAPDTYGTDDTGGNSGNSSESVGANHVIDPKLYLGATAPDADSNGFVDGTDDNGNATDDDDPNGTGTGNGDDEDDLTLPPLTEGDTDYTIPAANITATNTTGSNATLHAWIDFDNSGTFESTEHTSVAVNDATNGGNPAGDLTWTGITAGAAGNTYARFRLTTDSSIVDTTPGGAASDGEVEDYQMAIAEAQTYPELLLVKRITAINPGQPDEIQFNDFTDDLNTLDDNHPLWPDSDENPNSNSNLYLRGVIDGGQVKPDDEVEYTIYFLSSGDQDAQEVNICDVIPDHMTFVKDGYGVEVGIALGLDNTSLPLVPNQYLSNTIGDDRGDFYEPGTNPPGNLCQKIDSSGNRVTVDGTNNTNGAIIVRPSSSLPPAVSPGQPTDSYGFIRFRAKVK